MNDVAPRIRAIDVDDLLIEIVDMPETVDGDGIGGTAARGPGDLIDRLDAVGEKIGQVCSRLQTKALQTIGDTKPKSLEIEFGITLAGEAGIPFVTAGSVETSFTVKATWDFAAAAEKATTHNV
jgi:hypothetical protein